MKELEYVQEENLKSKFEGDFLQTLRIDARKRGIPVMLFETSQFVSTLVAIKSPSSILEIGTAVGYSGSVMLKYANENATLTTIEKDWESVAEAKENFEAQGLSARVKLFTGDALDIVPNMSGSFDFMFLDGPKSKYVEFLPYLKDMLKVGGVLVADNVLFRELISGNRKAPRKMNTIVNNLRSFIDTLFEDDSFVTSLYDLGDGLSVSVKIK